MRRLWYRKPRAGSFPVSRIAKAHPVSRSDSDPLPQVGIGPAERFAAVAQTVSAGKPSLRRGRCFHRPAGRPGWGADACVPPPAPGHHVGRAISPAAEPCGGAGFPGRCEHCRPQAAFRSAKYEVPALSAGIVPCGTQGKALPGFAGHLRRKAAMHPSVCALRRIHLPLQGRLLGDCRLKGSPGRGAVGKAD